MDISRKLKALRELNNYSINKVSKESGVAQSYISDLENGKSNPTIEKLEKIITVYNTTLAEFFNEDEFLDKDTKILIENIKELNKDKIDLLNRLINAMK